MQFISFSFYKADNFWPKIARNGIRDFKEILEPFP